MGNYDGGILTVTNWSKFTTRKDIKASSWFRLSNTFLEDPDFYDFSDGELLTVVYIFSQCSKRMTDNFRLVYAHAKRIGGRSEKDITGAIDKLLKHQIISIDVTHTSRARDVDVTLQTNKQTNKQTDTPTFDFESLYKKYPRKEGKSIGLRKCKSEIKTQDDYDSVSRSIDRYQSRLRREQTDPKFIKHFSTFMNSWRDELDTDAGKTNVAGVSRAEHTLFTPMAVVDELSPEQKKTRAQETKFEIARANASHPVHDPTETVRDVGGLLKTAFGGSGGAA